MTDSRQHTQNVLDESRMGLLNRNGKMLEVPEYETTTEVTEGEWRVFGSADAWVTTGALGPCMGSSLRDRVSGFTIVGHFPDVLQELATILKMLDIAEEFFGPKARVEIHLKGLAPDETDYTPTEAQEMREFLLSAVRDRWEVPNILKTDWGDSTHSPFLEINLKSGRLSEN